MQGLETHESGHCIDHEVVICDQRSDFLRISQVALHSCDVGMFACQGVQGLSILIDDGDFERFFFFEIDSHRATDEAAAKYDHFHGNSPFSLSARIRAPLFFDLTLKNREIRGR